MHEQHPTCRGELCNFRSDEGEPRCGAPAMHKVGEEQTAPTGIHNLTAYLCCHHFSLVMGSMAERVHGCGSE